jgi:hypothetical protein
MENLSIETKNEYDYLKSQIAKMGNAMQAKSYYAKVEVIDKEKAIQLLDLNINNNRKVRSYKVDEYAEMMKGGLWINRNGDTITITKSGYVIDGQHRLLAVIKSDFKLITLVVYNADDRSFGTKDIGAKRSAGDTLKVNDIKNASKVATIIKIYKRISNNVFHNGFTLQPTEILNEYNQCPELYQKIALMSQVWCSKFNRIMQLSDIGAYYKCFSEINEDAANKFFELLCLGINLTPDHPVYLLRKRFISVKTNEREHLPIPMKHALIVKTWNNFVSGKKLKVLKFDSDTEEFPQISRVVLI